MTGTMSMPRMLAATLIVALPAGNAIAQSGAKRPIRVLVASTPGGPSDIQIRLLVPALTAAFGQTIIVDNRPSNNGVVATEIAAKSLPDGHTFTVGNSGTHAVNATLYAKLPYDPVRDFAAVTEFATTGMIVAANVRLPGTSIQDLVALARKEAGKLNVAIPGATGQLAGDALWSQLQVKLTNIHYKGSAPSELAVVSGEADLSLLTPLATLTHLQAGKLKAYGITSVQRSPILPDVPRSRNRACRASTFNSGTGSSRRRKHRPPSCAPRNAPSRRRCKRPRPVIASGSLACRWSATAPRNSPKS